MNQVQQFLEYIFNAIKIWVIVQPWEKGIRVRNGKHIKKLEKGLHFKIPYFDSVYVQECRLRISQIPVQTLTSKDLKTITLDSSFGYSIVNIQKLYDTLYHPETTIRNKIQGLISTFIQGRSLSEINICDIEVNVLNELNNTEYGLKFEYYKITNFAVVRTFRLIQDKQWSHEGIDIDKKK